MLLKQMCQIKEFLSRISNDVGMFTQAHVGAVCRPPFFIHTSNMLSRRVITLHPICDEGGRFNSTNFWLMWRRRSIFKLYLCAAEER